MEEIVRFTVEDRDGSRQELEIPGDINFSLMEILKANGYNILATCGGMALCATCHVEVMNGMDQLPEAQGEELDMLDTLPDATHNSRLACQIRVNSDLEGAIFKIRGDETE